MAESKGWAQALRRVTRGGADWTVHPGGDFQTCGIGRPRGSLLTLRGGRKKDNAETQRALRLAERKGQAEVPVPQLYFLAALDLAAASAYFFWKRSTRPAVSTSFACR